MNPADQLSNLQNALTQLRAGNAAIASFVQTAQQQQLLMHALPARFSEVLGELLNRLESSALFSDESCSFSQSGLLDNVQIWLDKAALQLQKS